MKVYNNIYNSIISPDNLFEAWETFKSDKQKKPDVAGFEWKLEENLFDLHHDLRTHAYKHGAYTAFWIRDPKLRNIYKATVRDRILHHAVFRVLNPIFEPTFIATSFSCRIGKGTHRGMLYVRDTIRKISANYTRPCFVLKCDIRKFFDSVDQNILTDILKKRIKDEETISLLDELVGSYSSPCRERERERESRSATRKGIPIGNLTSQLFANIYMNEFDQFIKHGLGVKNYARYTDDFVVLSEDRSYLENLLSSIKSFLGDKLLLELHPKKVEILRYSRGVDFLGYVALPYHIAVRTKTKRRMMRKLKERIRMYKQGEISETALFASLDSYLGVLSHADAHNLKQEIESQFWYWLTE